MFTYLHRLKIHKINALRDAVDLYAKILKPQTKTLGKFYNKEKKVEKKTLISSDLMDTIHSLSHDTITFSVKRTHWSIGCPLNVCLLFCSCQKQENVFFNTISLR